MTQEQLHLLEEIGHGNIYRSHTALECEAVRAMLAERAELLEAILEARAFIYEHLGSGWAVGDILEALSRKANGGP